MASQAPNIDRLSNAFLVVSKESAKFGNIPALNQGAQILEALERVQQRVEQMQQRVEQMQQTQTQMQQTQTQMQQTQEQMQQTQEQMQIAIQRMFDRFETRAIASNLNATARTQNSVVSFADRRLTPLVNSVTGEEIEGFPDTPPRSPASSPSFHYAPAQAQSLPASPLSRRNSKSKLQPQFNIHGSLLKTTPSQRPRYVDASTQWASPVMNLKMEPPPSEPSRSERVEVVKQEPKVASPSTVEASATGVAHSSPSKPSLQPQSPTTAKRRQSRDGPSPSISTEKSPPKRAKSSQTQVKLLPVKYEFCEVEDLVVLIANMISELIQTNDRLPPRDAALTRFHSRTPPGISVLDYLQRLAKHATLTPPILLSMVYYIDRLCALYPAFTVTTLTIHRFLITAATVASKGLSDSFWNNATYARVGGIRLAELGLLELDFLYRVDWKIVPSPEVLVDYYHGLVERSDIYDIEYDSSSIEDDDVDVESDEIASEADAKPGGEEAITESKWKAWMEDVSTRKGGTADSDDNKNAPRG
ncbi:hypothetical protein G7Y89_g5893 [Cudoniella acicularis]|uniref:Nuc-1 negative regulatory protein preg n=1 Tax=Cudoniella acicularis TaxID=354080 RepID=A0A8H4W621_9HELO|nr:hypothetical protein G7Y89_g5893 [Cudoniella acicularis]